MQWCRGTFLWTNGYCELQLSSILVTFRIQNLYSHFTCLWTFLDAALIISPNRSPHAVVQWLTWASTPPPPFVHVATQCFGDSIFMRRGISFCRIFNVQVTGTNTWQVASQTRRAGEPTKTYTVRKLKDGPLQSAVCTVVPCARPCTQRQCVHLCRHMFSCTCADYEYGHLCKHVHAVHMKNMSSTKTLSSNSTTGTTGKYLKSQSLIFSFIMSTLKKNLLFSLFRFQFFLYFRESLLRR